MLLASYTSCSLVSISSISDVLSLILIRYLTGPVFVPVPSADQSCVIRLTALASVCVGQENSRVDQAIRTSGTRQSVENVGIIPVRTSSRCELQLGPLHCHTYLRLHMWCVELVPKLPVLSC